MKHRIPFIAAAVSLLLYLSFPAARYNFDGVACAIAVELGDLGHLVHGNHLAYGFLGYLWFLIWKVFGYSGPAIQSLQAFSSFLDAGAVGMFALMLTRCKLDPLLAGISAMGLAVSRVFWIWSLEVQIYPLGALFLFWAAAEILNDKPRPVKLGLLHGAAILGHVGHVMFFPVVFYLVKNAKARRQYFAALAGLVLLAYLAAAIFCVHPKSMDDVRTWLLGSAALRLDKKFQWHGGYSWFGLKQWIGVSLQMVGGDLWIGLAVWVAAGWGAFAFWRERPKIVKACLIWLAGYAVLFLSWEPFTPVYRLTDFAPLWVLASLGALALLKTIMESARRWAKISPAVLGFLVLILGIWNFNREIYPNSLPKNNAILQRSLWLARATPENAWIVVESADQVYVPYFAHRKPLNLRYFEGHEDRLAERIKELAGRQEPVFVAPATLSEGWQNWFTGSKLKERDRWREYTLYSIQTKS